MVHHQKVSTLDFMYSLWWIKNISYKIKWSGNLLAIAQRSLCGPGKKKRSIQTQTHRSLMQLATLVFLISTEWSREPSRVEMLRRILKHRIKSHFEMSLSRLQMIRFGCFCMDISLLYGRFVIWHHISLHHFSFVFYLKQKHNHFSTVLLSLSAYVYWCNFTGMNIDFTQSSWHFSAIRSHFNWPSCYKKKFKAFSNHLFSIKTATATKMNNRLNEPD